MNLFKANSEGITPRGSRVVSDTSNASSYHGSNGASNASMIGSMFSRTTHSSDTESDSASSRSFFTRRTPIEEQHAARLSKDPSITAARRKVTDAENAEKMADKALLAARMAVREAREHVKNLEREALEDARRAKARQAEVKSVRKSVQGLGRYN